MKKMLVLLLSGVLLSGISVAYAQIKSENSEVYYDVYKLMFVDKNYKAAIDKINTEISASPDVSEYYLLRGRIYEEMKNNKAALTDYDKAIQLDSKNEDAYYHRASLKMDMNSPQGAYIDATRCIQINPNNEHCYLIRSLIRSDLGDTAGANADMQRHHEAAVRTLQSHPNRLY